MTPFEWAFVGLIMGFFVGRIWQVVRDDRAHTEAYRALLGMMRISPDKAKQLLESVLEKKR